MFFSKLANSVCSLSTVMSVELVTVCCERAPIEALSVVGELVLLGLPTAEKLYPSGSEGCFPPLLWATLELDISIGCSRFIGLEKSACSTYSVPVMKQSLFSFWSTLDMLRSFIGECVADVGGLLTRLGAWAAVLSSCGNG